MEQICSEKEIKEASLTCLSCRPEWVSGSSLRPILWLEQYLDNLLKDSPQDSQGSRYLVFRGREDFSDELPEEEIEEYEGDSD